MLVPVRTSPLCYHLSPQFAWPKPQCLGPNPGRRRLNKAFERPFSVSRLGFMLASPMAMSSNFESPKFSARYIISIFYQPTLKINSFQPNMYLLGRLGIFGSPISKGISSKTNHQVTYPKLNMEPEKNIWFPSSVYLPTVHVQLPNICKFQLQPVQVIFLANQKISLTWKSNTSTMVDLHGHCVICV